MLTDSWRRNGFCIAIAFLVALLFIAEYFVQVDVSFLNPKNTIEKEGVDALDIRAAVLVFANGYLFLLNFLFAYDLMFEMSENTVLGSSELSKVRSPISIGIGAAVIVTGGNLVALFLDVTLGYWL